MKHLSRILPVAAVIAAVGGAIYYVHAQAAYRPAAVEMKADAPAPATLVPPSDRYANNPPAAS